MQLRLIISSALLVLLLQGCGQKGPLTLPQPEEPASTHTE